MKEQVKTKEETFKKEPSMPEGMVDEMQAEMLEYQQDSVMSHTFKYVSLIERLLTVNPNIPAANRIIRIKRQIMDYIVSIDRQLEVAKGELNAKDITILKLEAKVVALELLASKKKVTTKKKPAKKIAPKKVESQTK